MRFCGHLVLMVVCGVLLGCGQEQFQVETRLAANGDVQRTALAPAEHQPKPGDSGSPDAKTWSRTDTISGNRVDKHAGPLDQLFIPEPPADGQQPPSKSQTLEHRIMSGPFPAGTPWPAEFEITGKNERNSSPQRDIRHEDLGFVIVHHWNEMIPDVVTLSDHRRARVEVAERAEKLLLAAAVELYGDELDLQPVRDWFRHVVTNLWFDVCDEIYTVSAQERELEPRLKLLQQRLAAVMSRYKIPVLDDQGDFLKEKPLQVALKTYLRETFYPLLQRKDGQPVDVALLDRFLELSLSEQGRAERDELEVHPYTQALERVTQREFPDQKQHERYIAVQAERLFGLYHGILASPRHFRYELSYTGLLIKSDGTQLTDSRIVWEFDGPQVFPHGYRMTAEIASPQRELLDELAGPGRLTAPRDVERFVELAREYETVGPTLQQVIREKSWDAWAKYRADLLVQEDAAQDAVAAKIQALLGR